MSLTRIDAASVCGKHIVFTNTGASKSGRTRIFAVSALDGGTALGEVKWNAHWRKYWFEPYLMTGYEEECLRDIAAFIEQTTQEHRQRAVGSS